MNRLVPVHRHPVEIRVGLANRLQNPRYLATAGQKQMSVLERLQSRTRVEARSVRHGHPEVGVPVGINSKLGDIDGLLSQHALDGDADLSLVQHDGLRMENTPAR